MTTEKEKPSQTVRSVDQKSDRALSPEKLAIVDQSFTVNSIQQALDHGLTEEDIWRVCEGFSRMINEYNAEHPSEMLDKTPETLHTQLEQGFSSLILSRSGNEYIPLYHGSVYPVFEAGEEKVLGTQLVEFGSAIAHPDYRRGYKLGTRGAQNRLDMVQRMATDTVRVAGISTIKRLLTGHVWKNVEVNPISYWDFPYTAFLTDTCEGTSERFGHESCRYRRPAAESTSEHLDGLFKDAKDNPSIPCTLLTSDIDALRAFEARCQQLHAELEGKPLLPGDISVESYERAAWFFDQMNKLVKGE